MPDNLPKDKKLVSIRQAAEILEVSLDTIRRWDKSGKIHSSRPDGKTRYFSLDEIEKLKFTESMSIGDACKMLGISASTLRRIEKKGYIAPDRTEGGERRYSRETLQKFLNSEYFLRKDSFQAQILEPLKPPTEVEAPVSLDIPILPSEPSTPVHQETVHKVLGARVEDLARNMRKVLLFRKAFFFSGAFIGVTVCLLIFIITILFFIAPQATGEYFGYYDPAQESQKLTQVLGVTSDASNEIDEPVQSPLSQVLAPITRVSLAIVKTISEPTYNEAVTEPTVTDVAELFTLNEDGQIIPLKDLVINSDALLTVEDTNLIPNLNAEFVQGRSPGSGPGNLAILDDEGNLIIEGVIKSESVGTAALLDGSVTSAKIADGTITEADIEDGAVTADKLASGLDFALEDDEVTTSKIADDAITESQLADGSVTSSKISNNTITSSDLAATLTFSDGDYLDLSAILHDDTAVQGFRLPNVSSGSPSAPSAGEGYIAWDTAGNQLLTYDGSSWVSTAGDITDVTAGNGLTGGATTGVATLSLNLTTSGTTGSTSSNSGLEVGSGGLSLLKGCADNEILKWTDVGGWQCATDSGSGGAAITIEEGDAVVDATVTNIDFLAGDFEITESPEDEVNITLAATLTTVTGVSGDFTVGGGDLVGSASALTLDTSGAGTISMGSNATTVGICNSAACDTINIGTNADTDTITIGDSSDDLALTDAQWSITGAGAASFASVTVGGDTITEFVGTGLTNAGGTISTTLGTSIAGSEIDADTIDLDRIADGLSLDADLTFAAGNGEDFIVNKSYTDATTETGVTFNFTASDTSSGTTAQYGLYLDNIASTEGLDAAVVIDNSDTDDAVGAAIRIIDGGGGFTTLIDNNGTLISGAELNRLDGKDAALIDTNDAVATAITGTGILDAGSITSNFGSINVGTDAITTSGTITAGTLSVNSENFTDLTGNGVTIATGALTINLTSSGTTGSTASNSGLEVGSGGLTLLKGCTDNEILKYTDGGGWACASDATGAAGNTFETFDAPSGTDPVADSSTDTMTFAVSGTNITITGDSSADSLTFNIDESALAGAGLAANGSAVDVGAGNGISVAADTISVNEAYGFTFTGATTFTPSSTNDLDINLDVDSLLTIDQAFSSTTSANSTTITATNASTSGTQNVLYVDNAASTGATESLLVLDNSDTDTAVSAAIQIVDGGGGFTTLIDNNGTLISGAELNRLDGKDAALIDTNDAVATAITGTGTLTAGATGAGFTLNFGTSTLSGNIGTANISGVDISDDTNLTATNGITFTGDELSLASSTGGAGLTYTTGVLAVGAGTGISVAADSISATLGTDITNAELVDDTIDFDKVSDTASLDADTSITAGAGEDLTFAKTFTDASSENGLILNFTASDSSSGTTAQYGIYVDNIASTEGLDASIVIDNSDTDDTVGAAIRIVDAGGGFTTIIDNAGTLISGAELNRLDGKDAALIDTNDAVATAITGTGTLTAGATGAGFTINFGTSTLSGNIGTSNVSGLDISDDTNLTATNGITLTGDQLTLDSATGGAGLTYTTGVLAVGAGTGISVAADSISATLGTDITNAELVDDTVDFDKIIDSASLDADTSITAGAGEDLTFAKTFTDVTSESGLILNFTASDSTSGTTAQYGLYVDNLASTEGLDAAVVIDNSDTDDAVAAAIRIINAGGGFTTIIDNAGTLISGSELNLLDGGIALSELTDSGTLTATTVDINGGNIDGTVLGAASPAAATFTGVTVTTSALAVNSDSITSDGATLTINAGGTVDVQDGLTVDSLTSDTGGVSIAAGQSYTGAGAVTLSSGGSAALTLDSASGTVGLATNDDFSTTGDITFTLGGTESVAFTLDPAADTAGSIATFTIDGEDTVGSDESQIGLALVQSSNGTDVTEGADALLTFTNNDANDAVNVGIRFDAGAAGTDFVTGIDFDAADVTTEIVLENGESISNQTDNQISLGLGTNGTLILTSSTAATISSSAGSLILDSNGGTIDINDAIIDVATQATDVEIADASATALTISQGANAYITIDTTDGAENLVLSSGTSGTTRFVRIGATSSSTTPDLLVLDSKSDAGNPTGTSGALYMNSSNKLMINENGTWKELCNKTDAACGAGSGSSWSALTDPTGNLALSMAEYTSTGTWDTAATAATFDALTYSITNDAGTDANVQRLMVLQNNNDGAGTGSTEALLVLNNADANEAIADALIITSSGAGGITTGIDFDDTDIVTDIEFQNGETLSNDTDDMLVFAGAAGGDNTDLQIDLDGTHPVISSPTDGTIEIAEALTVSGTSLTATSATTVTLGSTGADTITIGNAGADTIAIGGAASTGVSITDDNWSITTAGAGSLASLTINSELVNDFSGSGIAVTSNALTVNLTSSGTTGSTASNSGLEVGAGGLTLLKGCADNEILKWTDGGGWACAADSTGGTANIFSTIDAPAGTDPVADSSTDTLTLAVTGTNLTITGDSSADSITIDIAESTLAGAGLVANGSAIDIGSGTGISVAADAISVNQDTAFAWTNGQTYTFVGTENLGIASDLAGSVNVLSITGTPSSTTGTTAGLSISQASSANSNGLDAALYIDNADADLAIPAAIQIANSGGGGYTTIINNAGTLISGTELNLLDGGIALSELTDSGTLTAGTVDINGGNIDGVTIGGASAGAGTFTQATITTGALAVNSDSITSDGATLTINAGGAVDIQDGLTADTLTVDAGNLSVSAGSIDGALSLSGTTADNSLQITLTNGTSSGTQNAAYIDNAASTGTTESLLVLDNSDTDTAVTAAIQIVDAGGGFTTIIDNAGTLISGAELNRLDGKDAALIDTNDAVATAITGTGTLTAGATGAGFTLNFGTSTLSGSIGTSNVSGLDISDDTNLTATNGITLTGDQLTLDSATGGAGLTYTTGVLAVGAGTGISVAADSISATLGTDITNAELVDDTVDFDKIIDSASLDADLAIAAGAGEDVTLNKTFTNNTGENALVLNLTASDTGSGTTTQYGLYIDNLASTEAADASLVLDNSDTDDAVGAAIRIVDAGGGFTTLIDNNGTLISGAELNRLDGKDAALIDTNDVVATAITGTGALDAGSITSNFGAIDVGSDNITTTGSVLGNSIDRSTGGALTVGDATATSVSICNATACDTVTIGTNTDADTITIGEANDDVSLTDAQWSITAAGAASFASVTSTGAIAANSASGITSTQSTLVINAGGSVDVQDGLTVDSATVDNGNLAVSTGTIDGALTLSGSSSDNLLQITLTNSSTSGTQNVAYFDNAASTGTTESLVVIDNSDADTAVTNAIEFVNAGGGFTNLFNVAGTAISSSEFTILDGGIALSELTDSGTLTAGTVDINGGAIDGVTIGGASAGAGTFSSLTSNGDLTVSGGDITGSASESIDIGELTDATFTFLRNDAGTVTLTANDNDTTAALLVTPGGSAQLTLGDSATGSNGDTVAIFSSDWEIDTTGAITGMSFDANGSGNSITNIESADIADSTLAPGDFNTQGTDTDEYCLTRESTAGAPFEWQACGGGTITWSSIGDATGDDTISFGSTAQVMEWQTMDNNAGYLAFNFTNAGTSAGSDYGVVINNRSNTSASTDNVTEDLLLLQQQDTSTGSSINVDNFIRIDVAADAGATDGIEITNSGGNLTNGINITDTAGGVITTAISFSGTFTNLLSVAGTNLSASEVTLLDGGVALSELSDSGTLTAGTVDINGGAIDGVTIGGASAGAGTFSSLTSNGDLTVSGGDVTGASGDSLDIGEVANSQFTFTINSDSTVVITSADSTDANTPLTVQSAGTGGLLLDTAGAGTITIGSAATTVDLCNSAACDTLNLGTNTDADTITIGEANDNVAITDAQWSVTGAGAGTFASLSVGETISDFSGDGLIVSAGSLAVRLDTTAADGASTTSVSGLEFVGGELSLIRGCSASQVLKWDNTNFEWDCGDDNNSGGSTAWDGIADPAGSGAIAFAATAQTMDWDTAGGTGALDGMTITFQNDITTDASIQRALVVQNANDGGSNGVLDVLLALNNADTNEAVTDAINISSSGGGAITTAIDIDDTDVVTDIELQNGETIDNNTDGVVSVGSLTNRANIAVYGDLVKEGLIDNTTMANVNDIFVYDTTRDSDGGAWTNSTMTQNLSWYSESKNDGPGDPCVVGTDTRCGKSEFPKKAIIVSTNSAVHIFDAMDNSLWMSFTQAGTYALGADASNNPSGVFALNGVIYVGTNGTGTGLYAFDFISDKLFNYDAADRTQGDKNIANRNTAVSYATNSITALAITATVNDVHGAVMSGSSATLTNGGPLNGNTFIAVATDDGARVINMSSGKALIYADGATTDDINQVWVTKRGRLYITNETLQEIERYNDIETSNANDAAPDDIWDEGTNYPNAFKTAPTFSTSPDALEVIERETYAESTADTAKADVIYVGHSQGLTEIHDVNAPSGTVIGWSKFYTSSFNTGYMSGTPRGYFPFNETTGDLVDATVRNNVLEPENPPTYGVDGVRGTGLSFNGTDDFLCSDSTNDATCDNDTDFDTAAISFHVEAWFRHPTTISGTDTLVSKKYPTLGGAEGIGYQIHMNSSGQMIFGIQDTAATAGFDDSVTSTLSFNDNEWHHLVAVNTDTAICLYIDGRLAVTCDTTLGATGSLSGNILTIGADGSAAGGANFWTGEIDDMYFAAGGATTSDTLTQAQVRRKYMEGRQALSRKSLVGSTATSGTASTIVNSGLSMTPNDYAGSIVEITAGTGAGQTRRVISNTATTLTVSPDWTATPSTDSVFEIQPEQLYGSSNVVDAISVTDTDFLGRTRRLYVGTNQGSDGGGVTVFQGYGNGYASNVYHSDAGMSDDSGTAWSGTDFDDIKAIDARANVVAFGSVANTWVERIDQNLEQSYDLLANNINSIRAELLVDGLLGTSPESGVLGAGADLAEYYTSDTVLEPGMLVSLHENNIGGVVPGSTQNRKKLLGVVATEPGLILGTRYENSYPIALAGRVPVKVTTQNGLIKAGDSITASSHEGFGMKALVASRIVGIALNDVDEASLVACSEGSELMCGEVTMFVNPQDYNGTSLGNLILAGGMTIETPESKKVQLFGQVGAQIQQYFTQYATAEMAGETEGINTTSITAVTMNVDTLYANKIKADSIEGLEIYTDKIESLTKLYENMQQQSDGGVATEEAIDDMTAKTYVTLSVLSQLEANGSLQVLGASTFKGIASFEDMVTFAKNVIFKDKVEFQKYPIFSANTAGYIVVQKGQRVAEVTFETPYSDAPIVTASVVAQDAKEALDVMATLGTTYILPKQDYVIANITPQGFAIILDEPAVTDIKLSWVALAISQPQTSVSTPAPVIATPSPEVTPEPEVIESTVETEPSLAPSASLSLLVVSPEVGFVRVRETSSSDSTELTQIPDGVVVQSSELSQGWYKVEYEGVEGWVSGQYVVEQ